MKEFLLTADVKSLFIWATVAVVFIGFDILSGWIKGLATNHFQTAIMRAGLFHKLGSLLAIALGVIIDLVQEYLDLGFAIHITAAICAYIILMEIVSVVENICEINPEIMPDRIISLLGLTDKLKQLPRAGGEEDGDKQQD